jgi:hypothetical protein
MWGDPGAGVPGKKKLKIFFKVFLSRNFQGAPSKKNQFLLSTINKMDNF